MILPTLSVSLIVGNEILHIERVLGIAKKIADEIIVVDTGSTDGTRQISERMGAIVYDFNWCDDFSRARNESLKHCTKDFVMWLDADDILTEDSVKNIKALFSSHIDWDVLYLPYYYNYSANRRAKRSVGKRKMPPRIWRNHLGVHWIYPIHEHLSYPHKMRKQRGAEGVAVLHDPLGSSDVKSNRNLRIMKAAIMSSKYKDDSYILWHIAKEFSQLGNPRQAVKYFKSAIESAKKTDRFRLARLYFGLARQYRRMDNPTDALLATSKAAIAYPYWREPFVEMAEALSALGDARVCSAVLDLAQTIPLHDKQVERVELYDTDSFDRLRRRLLGRTSVVAGSANTESKPAAIKLIAAGDVNLGRQMSGFVKKHSSAWPLEDISCRLLDADIALANLENVVSTLGDFADKGGRSPFYYRSRPEMLDVLVDAGINIVSVANNHAGDFGPEALEQQIEILDSIGMAHCGAGADFFEAASPAYVESNGHIVAVIAIETETPVFAAGSAKFGINYVDHKDLVLALLPSICLARLHAHTVIVTPHWGKNWADAPSEQRRGLAKAIIDIGVDAVLGHSAHILQGVEVYRGRPIIYDMGTLLFDRVRQSRMKQSALFELVLGASGAVSLEITPLDLCSGQAYVASERSGGDTLDLLEGLSRDLNPDISFERKGASISLVLRPDCPHHRLIPSPMRIPGLYHLGKVRRVDDYYRNLESNLEYSVLPDGLLFEESIQINEWLEVLGARWSSHVAPRHGFFCEVFLRLKQAPPVGRWEARVTGVDADGKEVFSYRHPLGEGVISPSKSLVGKLLGDRVIVRPSAEAPEGTYQLYWNMTERDSERRMTVSGSHERLFQRRCYLGSITISERAPKKVAGVGDGGLLNAVIANAEHDYGPVLNYLEGWQCNIYVFDSVVIKQVKSLHESIEKIRYDSNELIEDVEDAARAVLASLARSARIIFERRVPGAMIANLRELEPGCFIQKKVAPLSTVFRQCAKSGDSGRSNQVIRRYIELIKAFWRYGIHETSWKVFQNFGVNTDGEVVLIDCFEVTDELALAKQDVEQKLWSKAIRYSGAYGHQVTELISACEESLTLEVLHECWPN